jgi:hypothetical protein
VIFLCNGQKGAILLIARADLGGSALSLGGGKLVAVRVIYSRYPQCNNIQSIKVPDLDRPDIPLNCGPWSARGKYRHARVDTESRRE